MRKISTAIKRLGSRSSLALKRQRSYRVVSPLSLVFFVTNVCNYRCSHCFYLEELNKEPMGMSLDEITALAKSLSSPLESLTLTGGEASLRRDLPEICGAFVRHNGTKRINIPTNGSRPGSWNDLLKKIRRHVGPRTALNIQVSLDGDREIHDAIRGKGSFGRAMKTIEVLKSLKEADVSAMITVSEKNVERISGLASYLERKSVAWKYQFVRSSDEVFNIDPFIVYPQAPHDRLPTLAKMQVLSERLDKRNESEIQHRKNQTALRTLAEKKRQLPCKAGVVDAVLFPDGEVALCEMTRPVGNVRDHDHDFLKLWHSEKAERMRVKTSGCACIHSCNLISSILYPKVKLARPADTGEVARKKMTSHPVGGLPKGVGQ